MRKAILFIGIVAGILTCCIAPSFAYLVTFEIIEGTSYQDEGTLTYDDTAKLKYLDGNTGPTITGTVGYNYYATGTNAEYFDGVSAKFDLTGATINSATLMAYIKSGTYNPSWHQYELYQGAFNNTDEDAGAYDGSFHSFDYDAYSNGGWISHDVPISWITSNNLNLSLRLWNASIDQIKLEIDGTSGGSTVPEPASLSLLGFGLLGAIRAGMRRKLK